jgi:murein DD-endopeptidase MepM/ murein hydrolase activator NlpD
MKLYKFRSKRAVLVTALSFGILLAGSIVLWPLLQQFGDFFRKKGIPPLVLEYGIPVDSFNVATGEVAPGKNLGEILGEYGVSASQVDSLSKLSEGKFDLRSIRAGHTYKAFVKPDSTQQLAYWVYEISPVEYVVFSFTDKLGVEVAQKPVRIVRKISRTTIKSSLWKAIADAKMNTALALELSEVYAWEIDFFGLKRNDNFKVVYDEMFVDSTSIGISKIYSAVFNHMGKDYYAFSYMQDSINSYWDEKGQSLKKAFLKAPLKFSRITSGYSMHRRHPVLKIFRPHQGIDYAAPVGTPVMTIGSGVVVLKTYSGSAGYWIKVKHSANFTTAYMHLSRFARGISLGGRVQQGQVIGFVGSTGYSTGAHLDFRVWKGSSPINPLKVQSPPEKPLRMENLNRFMQYRNTMIKLLK